MLDSESQVFSANSVGGNGVNQWHDPNITTGLCSSSRHYTEKVFFNSAIDLSGIYWGDVVKR